MPTKIAKDFKPSPRVAELLAVRYPELTQEKAQEFINHELAEFTLYWEGINGKAGVKANWDTTCLNRMKNLYAWKKEAMAGSHQPSQGDVFDMVLQEINSIGQVKVKITNVRKLPPPVFIPPDLGTMTTEQGIEALSKLRSKL